MTVGFSFWNNNTPDMILSHDNWRTWRALLFWPEHTQVPIVGQDIARPYSAFQSLSDSVCQCVLSLSLQMLVSFLRYVIGRGFLSTEPHRISCFLNQKCKFNDRPFKTILADLATRYLISEFFANFAPFEVIFNHFLTHIGQYLSHNLRNVWLQAFNQLKDFSHSHSLLCSPTNSLKSHDIGDPLTSPRWNFTPPRWSFSLADCITFVTILLKPHTRITQVVFFNRRSKKPVIIRSSR